MIRLFVRKLVLLVHRRRAMDDLAEEMHLHIELRAEALRKQGIGAEDALRRAQQQFGNELVLREESGDMWGLSALERLGKDAQYAYRQLVRRPGWTLMVLLTLALGIGANTSIFALANAMLFKSAPGQRPEQLVWVAAVESHSGRFRNMSYPGYTGLRDRATTMSGLMAYSGNEFSIGGQHAQRVFGDIVSGNYFDVLGIPAAIGRTFAANEDVTPGAHPVVVFSDRLWRDRFGADPHIVDTVVVINGHPFTAIGVAPPDFVGVELGEDALLWVPMAMQRQAMPSNPDLLIDARAGWLRVVGRLRDGRSASEADAEVQTLSKQMEPPGTRPEDERIARVTPIESGLDPANRHELMPIIELISVVPALVLLVACFNVANVLMARNVARRKELAMRRAVGASRGRLIGQLLVEALLLAVLAAGCGFFVSFGLTALVAHFGTVPAEVTSLLRPDSRVLAATTALAVLTTLIFGLAPALSATGFDLSASLKSEGVSTTAGGGARRLRNAFVVAQVSVSLALLVAAGLFLQSLSKALSVDPGFDPHGAATVSFDAALQGYSPERGDLLAAQLIEAAASLPGATAASATTILPLSGRMSATDAVAEDSSARVTATYASIAPRYFDAMRIGVIAGRDFTSADGKGATPVAIINQTLARRLWPGGDALGRRIRSEVGGEPQREVVGIVRDGKYARLTEQPRAAIYLPLAQRAQPPLPLTLVVRSAADPSEILRGLVAAARRIDPDMPLYRVQTLEATVSAIVDKQRATASLLGVFGIIALLLAATGIYGVAAHSVSTRTREIGIRMSLGARVADVSRMFVTEMLTLAAIGVVIGIVISAAASRLLATFLFGLGAMDAITFAGAAALICGVAIVASYLPARSAARIDPLLALRQD